MKKINVSIGIPAYNEEHNIKNVLMSICAQKGRIANIEEINVVSDASTDETVELAKSINDQRIKVLEFAKRKGKPTILNKLFRKFKGDVLVILDADTILNDEFTIEKLVSKFRTDKSIGIITGNAQPLPPETFLESAINNYIYARNALFDKYSFSTSAYIARGFLAYSRKFLSSFTLPEDILNDDAYSYFYCIKSKFKVLHEGEALVWYRSPQFIKEHVKQSTRHLAGGVQLYKYFGQDVVDKGFKVSKMASVRIMLYQLLRNPIGYVFLKILNTYCYYKSRRVVNKLDAKWEVVTTSKNLATRY